MTPAEIAAALRGVANDIETHGHYQDPTSDVMSLWNAGHRNGECCVLVNPTLYELENSGKLAYCDNSISEFMYEALGTEGGLVGWSDATPTAEVLATLHRRADEIEKTPPDVREAQIGGYSVAYVVIDAAGDAE